MATKIGNRLIPNGGSSTASPKELGDWIENRFELGYPYQRGPVAKCRDWLRRCFSPQPTSFTDFLQTVVATTDGRTECGARKRLEKVYRTGYETCKAAGIVKAAMGEETGIAGGYTVPLDYSLRLMETIAEESFIYPRANIIPMTSAETVCPKIDVETIPAVAGTSPFFGGIKFVWGSSQSPTETEPKFRQLQLKCWDLLGYATVSNQFLQDIGPRGEDFLVKLFGRAAAWYAEYAFLQGLGAAQQMPLGILNSPAALTVTRQNANQIGAPDIAAMAAALLPFSWRNAIWAVSPTCLAQVVKITNFFLNSEGKEGGEIGQMLSRPIFITEKLAALGTQGDLLLFDPSLYVVGDRMQVLIDVSPVPSFKNYQTDFRVWLRMDGKPQVSNTITLADKTTIVSPYVVLK